MQAKVNNFSSSNSEISIPSIIVPPRDAVVGAGGATVDNLVFVDPPVVVVGRRLLLIGGNRVDGLGSKFSPVSSVVVDIEGVVVVAAVDLDDSVNVLVVVGAEVDEVKAGIDVVTEDEVVATTSECV